MEETKKYCNECKNLKKLNDFYTTKTGIRGRKAKCKDCSNFLTREKRRIERENRPKVIYVIPETYCCSICKIIKPLMDFGKNSNCKNGRHYTCKSCMSDAGKKKWQRVKNSPEHDKLNEYRRNYNKTWFKKNKERERERARKYRLNNAEKLKATRKKFYERNPNYSIIQNREYREKNKDKINKRNRKYLKNRRKNDPNFRISSRLRARLGEALKDFDINKTVSTMELFGCNQNELRNIIKAKFKPGMSWENTDEWELDHTIPCFSFDLTKVEEQRKCFHHSNLQPLWKEEHRQKTKRDRETYPRKWKNSTVSDTDMPPSQNLQTQHELPKDSCSLMTENSPEKM